MIWRLLRDYARRTSGAWLLVIYIQIIQSVLFWAVGVRRAPLLGAVVGGLIYALSSEQPLPVLQTLPLTRTNRFLFRWLASFALPAAVVLACMAAASALNLYKGWPLPTPASLLSSALLVITLLSWLTAFPARGYATIVWAAAALSGLIGLPTEVTGLPVVGFLSIAISLALSFRESTGAAAPGLTKTALHPRFHGWGVLLVEVGRSTALVCAGALAATVIIHGFIPGRFPPALHGVLIWLFVSAIAAATSLPMRRWIEAVRSLRILPLDSHRLALTLYFILTLPGVVTCLVVIAAQALSPNWGLDLSPYLLVVFLLAPVTLVRWHGRYERRPNVVLQQAVWPLWAGSLCSLGGLRYLPAWFTAELGVIALFFAVLGYRALLGRIRSTGALEGETGVLLDAA